MYRQQPILFDVVTVGRAVVDLYPLEDGLAPKDVRAYGQYLGGSPTNVAVASARAGLSTAVVTRTGDDLFHEFVMAQLEEFGVDTRWAAAVPGTRTTLAVCDLSSPQDPGLEFFRDAGPPENTIDDAALMQASISCRVLWLTASGFAESPSGPAHLAALERAKQSVLDLDYRPGFWPSTEHYRDRVVEALGRVTLVIGNEQECAHALGSTGSAVELARDLLDRGPSMVVVKRGAQGAVALSADGVVEQEAFAVDVVNGLGAGDAFGGYYLKGHLEGWPVETSLRYAAAAGAIVASRRGCSVDMPTPREVAALAES